MLLRVPSELWPLPSMNPLVRPSWLYSRRISSSLEALDLVKVNGSDGRGLRTDTVFDKANARWTDGSSSYSLRLFGYCVFSPQSPMCLIVILRATLSNCAKHSITNTYPLKYEIVQYFLKSELVVPTYRIIFIFHIHYIISVEKPRNIEYTLLFKLIFFSEYTDTGHLYVYLYKDRCIISGLYFQILELKNLRIHKKQFYTK